MEQISAHILTLGTQAQSSLNAWWKSNQPQNTKNMKIPTTVLSHCLAHGPSITPDGLRESLKADKALGFGGMVIVPAIIDPTHTPEAIAQIFYEMKMTGLVCGFNPGNGPDPLGDEASLCVESLRSQAEYAIALADKGCGPATIVGPVHTHHMTLRPKWPADGFKKWMDKIHALAVELDLDVLFEPLNSVEDGTPDPFWTLYNAVLGREQFGLQWDTGHAYARALTTKSFSHMAHKVGYFEFANVGRNPLDNKLGIDFSSYIQAMENLPGGCVVGDEPFDQSVIQAFGLQQLCTTMVPGPECLARDATFLRSLGVMVF